MEKANLILLDGLALATVLDLVSEFSAGVVKLLGIAETLDLVSFSAGTLSLSLAGLGFQSGSKKIKVHVERNEVNSEKVGVSEVLDAENLESTVAEKTSYMDPNTSETDEIEDDTTPRKT
ncbi:hypothetical protein G9A89_022005 [Geosiphon pyriformis]|nr:hypothetical protein G9A89_022005 [Geosiphon pyriformis]